MKTTKTIETYKSIDRAGLSLKEATEALRRGRPVYRESDGAVCRLAGARPVKSPYSARSWTGGELVALTQKQLDRVRETEEMQARFLARDERPMTRAEDRQLAADIGAIPERDR